MRGANRLRIEVQKLPKLGNTGDFGESDGNRSYLVFVPSSDYHFGVC